MTAVGRGCQVANQVRMSKLNGASRSRHHVKHPEVAPREGARDDLILAVALAAWKRTIKGHRGRTELRRPRFACRFTSSVRVLLGITHSLRARCRAPICAFDGF
jgi:hypothetical protein